MGMKSHLVITCILLILCALPIELGKSSSETFLVPAENSVTKEVKLNEGDEVSGRVTVVGVQESAINFSISDPYNNTILSYQNVGLKDFHFSASSSGSYSFHFENFFSQENKHVTLNYNTQHYIFGFPQEYILVFIIVGIAIVAVIAFVALSPKP